MTALAEKEGMSAKVIAEGGWGHVLKYNTVSFYFFVINERGLDEYCGRGRAASKVDISLISLGYVPARK